MNKILKKILCFCWLIPLLVFSSGCSTATVNSMGVTPIYKIGILVPAVEHGWVAGIPYYAEQRCKELNNEIEYKILKSANSEEMALQLNELTAWGCDAIVAFPQWKGLEPAIQSVVSQGAVVVNCDIEMNVDGVYTVVGDNKGMGSQSAQYIVNKIGSKGRVVMVDSTTDIPDLSERKEAFLEKIKQIAPEIKIITCQSNFTREDAENAFAQILDSHVKIDAVYSMDDETSIGVLQAIKKAKRSDIKVVTGGGGSQEYLKLMSKNKKIWVQSALYSPSVARDAVDMALSAVKGQHIKSSLVIPTSIIDRSNCKDWQDENSPY